MKLQTRDFGEIEVAAEDIIQFTMPIVGFEELKQFVMLYEEDNQQLIWLQSVENPYICFILADPSMILTDYAPTLSAEAKEALGEGEYWMGLIVVVAEKPEDMTINLKCPIVINPNKQCGIQTVLEGDYPIRRPLFGEQRR